VRYVRINGRMNFYQAKAHCRRRGGRLATVMNAAQNRAVLHALRGVPKGRVYWLGLNDIRREGHWYWNNGHHVRYR
jgi:hypothetical protein